MVAKHLPYRRILATELVEFPKTSNCFNSQALHVTCLVLIFRVLPSTFLPGLPITSSTKFPPNFQRIEKLIYYGDQRHGHARVRSCSAKQSDFGFPPSFAQKLLRLFDISKTLRLLHQHESISCGTTYRNQPSFLGCGAYRMWLFFGDGGSEPVMEELSTSASFALGCLEERQRKCSRCLVLRASSMNAVAQRLCTNTMSLLSELPLHFVLPFLLSPGSPKTYTVCGCSCSHLQSFA